jgi:molecular chaperone HtpG
VLSKENPRRLIQMQVIKQKGIEQISDNPQIIREYDVNDLSSEEFAFTLKLITTLKDDYLIGESKVFFAEISHQVPIMVALKNEIVHIYLSRNSGNIQQVLKIYKENYNLFDGFVKDYIRNYLYPHLAQYVPSSTRQGADALFRILQKNKELYTIEYDDMGDVESLFKEYLSGKIGFTEVFKSTRRKLDPQTQTVNVSQIGTVEQELSTIITHGHELDKNIVSTEPSIALPPIKLLSNDTKKKMLKTDIQYPQLNNFTLFLALSDKIFNRQLDFFLEPHTTKVIWGMHKIVYIFTHASGRITMYYDIELKNKLSNELTGGKPIRTTTIISKNRLFVPIIPELLHHFDVKTNSLSFYVRYDTISDLEIE